MLLSSVWDLWKFTIWSDWLISKKKL